MIHYHGTPCGGTRQGVVEFLSGRHALVPWVRPEDLIAAGDVCQSFCLDNGAFSAWKAGKPIEDWRGYYAWVSLWRQHPAFDFAIVPDVIDGTEEQNDDLLTAWRTQMWRAWDCGAPVWHLHESLERLANMVRSWSRVCLGSSGEYSSPGTSKWKRRMDEAMQVVCDGAGRPLCRLHGLRMLNRSIVDRYPLSSADSTYAVRSSSLTGRFGMYAPPTSSQRMAAIANIIESVQSPPVYVPTREVAELFTLSEIERVNR